MCQEFWAQFCGNKVFGICLPGLKFEEATENLKTVSGFPSIFALSIRTSLSQAQTDAAVPLRPA
jgi:hypothetical protein